MTPCGRDDAISELVLGPEALYARFPVHHLTKAAASAIRALQGTGVDGYVVLSDLSEGGSAAEPAIADIAKPATVAVFGLGLVALGLAWRRRRRSRRLDLTRPPHA